MRRVSQREHRRAIAALHRIADRTMARVLHQALAPTVTRLHARHAALIADASDDLAGFGDAWLRLVDDELQPMLAETFGLGTLGAARQLKVQHADAIAAIAATPSLVPIEAFVSAARLRWLTAAESRWSDLGDTVWAMAKRELLAGITLGESTDQLAERLLGLGDIAGPTANNVARSLAVASANAGSFAEVSALGDNAPGGRIWISSGDARVRAEHADSDGQVVAFDQPFDVGGEALDFPGDPSGSDWNVFGCRCAIGYTDLPPEEGAPNLENITMQLPTDEAALALVAAAEQHTGGMVALVPTEADAQRLAVDGYEPPDVLHATLAFLGDGAQLPDEVRAEVQRIVGNLAAQTAPIVGNAHGIAVFNAASDEPATVYLVGDTDLLGPNGVPPLVDVHDRLWAELDDYGSEGFPDQHSPWVPHIAAGYDLDLTDLPGTGTEVTFDRLRVAFGTDMVTDYPLATGDTVPVTGGDTMSMTDEQATNIGEKVGASLITALGLATTTNGAGTVTLAAPPAVAPPAPPPDATPILEPTPPENAATEPEEFHILLVTEEQATLEAPARFFVAQCFDWREPPFPLDWQATDTHSEAPPAPTVQVGLITRVERQGLELHAWGTWDDPANLDAVEARRRVENGMLRWNSVVIGDVGEADIELVFPPPGTLAPDGIEVMEPDEIRFHHGRIVRTTLVMGPAQENAQIEPLIYATDQPMLADGEVAQEIAEVDEALTAAAYAVSIPDIPPDAWFQRPPRELLRRGALTITDEGRVYGLLAPGAVPHVGLAERRTVPLRNVDYSDFLRGETPVLKADGTAGRVVTGNLTMACGHASPTLPNGATVSHYDNSCSLFATATCGEADGDVWVAGALLPGVEPDQVRRAMACQLSGHWNPHELARGRYSLLAGLLVPIPGFPKGRNEATATTRWGPNDDGDLMLVASAVPVRFEATPPDPVALSPVAERIARSVGLDRRSRAEALAARVNGA